VFFVISGFLITRNAMQRWGSLDRINVRAFYVRRAARILPCLVLLVAVLSVLHMCGVPDYTINREGQSLAGAVLSVFGLYLNWYEGSTGYLPGNWDVLWSLSIEEVFYLGFPLACLVIRNRRLLVTLLVVLALSLPMTRAAILDNEIWREKAYLPGMAAIATGVLAALGSQRWQECSSRMRQILCTLGCSGIAANLLFGSVLWPLIGHALMLVLTLSAGVLLYALKDEQANSPRGLRWLESMGRLSYEIYLTHMFVVFSVVMIFRGWSADSWLGFLWCAPIVALCWLLGAVLAHGYSVPLDRALRAQWLSPPSATTSPAT
jgi:peptidoglycan/LPS O-acetylase OafA/YrhL